MICVIASREGVILELLQLLLAVNSFHNFLPCYLTILLPQCFIGLVCSDIVIQCLKFALCVGVVVVVLAHAVRCDNGDTQAGIFAKCLVLSWLSVLQACLDWSPLCRLHCRLQERILVSSYHRLVGLGPILPGC